MAVQDDFPLVMHRAQLLANGITDDEIKTARRTGSWTAIHRGAYCASDELSVLSPEQQYRLRSIAVARRSPNLVLSHLSAAAVLGLPLVTASLDRVHLTRPGNGGGRTGPGRVVHIGRLDPSDIGRVSGTKVTSPVRTAIDVACSSSFGTTVAAVDAALQRRLITPDDLAAAFATTEHRRGAAAARRALGFADGRCESVGESLLRVAMRDAGLPEPELQVSVVGRDGSVIARADLGYPDLGVLIEFDGAIKYNKLLRPGQRSEDVVLAEKLREDRMRDLGYVVIRLVWAELRDANALGARINAALARGRKVVATAGISGSWFTEPAVRIAA